MARNVHNILTYTIINIISTTDCKADILVKSILDGQLYRLTVYDKQAVYSKSKHEVLFKKYYYIRHFYPQNLKLYQDFRFLFSVTSCQVFSDLQKLLNRFPNLTEPALCFLTYEVLKNLDLLHKENLVHLNICPKSIGLDKEGNIFLQGFDYIEPSEEEETGKAFDYLIVRKKNWEYTSPELLSGQRIDFNSDFYGLGILLYFMLLGVEEKDRPTTIEEYEEYINNEPLQVKKNRIPEGWSLECADFINKLIQVSEITRLGLFSSAEIYSHVWMETFKNRYEQLLKEKVSFLDFVISEEEVKVDRFYKEGLESKIGIKLNSYEQVLSDCLQQPDPQVELEFEVFDDITDN